MGTVSDVLKYDYPVTALQFDSRKIVACAGENGLKVRPAHTPPPRSLSVLSACSEG